jgi:hypothetical protein
MPADMDFLDIRKGSDAEFGQSIYEPFGIAQVEPISFGGICVFTGLCGCAGFVRKAAGNKPCTNAIEVDYTRLPERMRSQGIPELLKMDEWTRAEIEQSVASDIADELFRRLPRTQKDFETLIASGGKLGAEMGWDSVSRNFVLPGMARAMAGSGGKK